MIKNILSVDLESFAHREQNPKKRKKDNGFTLDATRYLLELFDSYTAKATFFVLGEIFELYPQLIEEIDSRGHEIAYHGHSHILIKDKDILLQELKKSEKFIKKFKPIGFRAPRMYLSRESVSVLQDFGFRYDSSTYGQHVFDIQGSSIKELPVSLLQYSNLETPVNFPQNLTPGLLLQGIPYGSGLGISIFQKYIQHFITRSNKQNTPAVLCIHPWQFFDYDLKIPYKSPQNMLRNIYKRKINKAVEYLLSKNKFIAMREFLYE